jgi:hypothetical protein
MLLVIVAKPEMDKPINKYTKSKAQHSTAGNDNNTKDNW